MKFSVDKQEKYTLLTLEEGKLDSTIAPELKSELIQLQTSGTPSLILNLAATNYIDSSGLSALLVGNRTFSENGGAFILSGVTPFVEKLLAISQLQTVLNISPDNETGVAMILAEEAE